MSRRDFFALGGAGAAVAGLSLTEAMSGRRDEPNLLVIMTDDQPYYTVDHTEAVASLVRDRGTDFSPYAYVSTPICGPARAALLTGKWSHNRGLTKTASACQDLHASIYESDTIATRLERAGYSTYFGGKYTNGYDGQAVPSGWDAWFAMVEPINEADSFLYRDGNRTRRYYRSEDNETDVLGANAERFVRDRADSSAPWSAYVGPHASHSSYYPAPRHADEFATTRP
ncbi:MAG TPA: sulfatase-like hydrolase/transferase [Rubrobacter sp.]|nr:sulfatase-like hydrolase/transferase [Rubrobacter sp.]